MIKSTQDYKFNDFEPRKTVVVNQSFATSAYFSFSLQPHIRFQPKYMIVRQILYAPTALGNDQGTFLLWSSIERSNIAAFNVGVQSNATTPQTVIPITTQMQSIDFNVTAANGGNTPTGYITLTLEFC